MRFWRKISVFSYEKSGNPIQISGKYENKQYFSNHN